MSKESKKRAPDEPLRTREKKRTKVQEDTEESGHALAAGEVDFPRGGGTSFTPVEYKSIRAQAIQELKDEDIFKDSASKKKGVKGIKKAQALTKEQKSKQNKASNDTGPRVEHLNYKRVTIGMRLLCQVISVLPLEIIVSLPNQLFGHIPITNISSQLTNRLQAIEELAEARSTDEELDEESVEDGSVDLANLFHSGQYVRAIVTGVKPSGTMNDQIMKHLKDDIARSSRRVELSLIPKQVNQGLVKADLSKGFNLTAAVQTVEDHGYTLDVGIDGISGFLRFSTEQSQRWPVGALVDVTVESLAEDGRTCLVKKTVETNVSMKRISNAASILPGVLMDALITSITSLGLVVQILGSFVGTVDLYHLPRNLDPGDFKEGSKLQVRVLYDVPGTSPPQYALSANEHIVDLRSEKENNSMDIPNRYPIGTILPSVRVKRVEAERGIIVNIDEGPDGFVHISHVSDEHVPSLAAKTGPWKVGSEHRARVTGFHALDRIVQLSLRPSVLSQKFLRVDDVEIGEIIRGTVKKLTDSALFVSINGNVDAMIWPAHYADIRLKHPERRFKPGATIKTRVLAIDSSRKRIMLTAKKSLVESDLPIICAISDASAGLTTHGAVVKHLEKGILIEFFGNMKAIVPLRELSDGTETKVTEAYPIGKVVRVRILSVSSDQGRIVASIKQVSHIDVGTNGLSDVEVGQIVSGTIKELHQDNILLILNKPRVHALISINNVANRRNVAVQSLRSSLRIGESMDNLVVVSRNLEKGFVIVANQPFSNTRKRETDFNFEELKVGSIVNGKVIRHGRHGAVLRFPSRVTGILNSTDVSDDFDEQAALPAVDTAITASVLSIDRSKKHLVLSTRKSRLGTSTGDIRDREIESLDDLKIGDSVRGFVKSVVEHGLFVTIGRDIDARIQIKELYDEYVKDWKAGFNVNQLVEGRILSVDGEKKQVEMTLRSKSARSRELAFSDLKEGQKVDGKIKKVEDYGIFVQIEGSKLSGLCHKTEIADNKDADIAVALRNFQEGDLVKAVILKLDSEKRRISLGLKPSYFSDDIDMLVNEEAAEDGDDDDVVMEENEPITNSELPGHNESDDDSGDESDVPIADASILELSSMDTSKVETNNPAPIMPKIGFQWTAEDKAESDESVASDDDEEEEDGKPQKKRKRKAIEQDLTAEMHTRTPESVSDFERHLLASPNSSYLWIQYMSFHLQLSDIEKAKEVGKRALRAISIREEQEKLNVWIALLNLEVTYGTDETVEALFREASRFNDSKTIHLRLAAIFESSEKPLKAEEQYRRTSKKFGKSSKVWTLFGEHYLSRGLFEEARKLLPRSLQSLEKRKHLKTISKFAQLEYKMGDPERGKTIFEGIIESHPKRWDIWSIYVDMEATQKDIQSIRSIFNRVFAHKMTSFKAKAFFKKWLDIERRMGDEEGQTAVKEKAIEWTQKTSTQ